MSRARFLQSRNRKSSPIPAPGGTIRTFTVSLIGAAALAAGLILLRQHKAPEDPALKDVPPGESVPTSISLERLRELGY